MSAPETVRKLVERFLDNKDEYLNPHYNETQARREFIDPLFKELGWDIDNRGGLAEAYKDVVHEDAIRVGGATKAPDYCFRIGGARKFFVEAKKPGINLFKDPAPAFQLRRYAWSSKLPLSILTDFDEFAVYDCRIKPQQKDPAGAARVLYFTHEQYLEKWDEIAGIFSKEAILKGSFDKYAQSTKRKRGTMEVDDAFLAEIEDWRDRLARNVAIRNPGLTQRELNQAVQKTIDRIIFLRICEDRSVEPYGRLQALENGKDVYARLGKLFQDADDRYNSGLFHFRGEKDRPDPDKWTLGLTIDDKILKEMIKDLYYPAPYEFSVLPADILGQIYERFLGKVIRLTPGHRAVVEEKPEVRKAGGVYYTPTYIVDYIVKNTVGKLLEDKTPRQADKLRILDPACGSGSFLIAAYQYLLNWHREWYLADGAEKHRKVLIQTGESRFRLTTAERKRILLNNIYGVDIDAQAVEVTKLSLLLKVLEGETKESIASQLAMFRERALPDLSANIRCGNSLISSDFYQGQQISLLADEELDRINVFDWSGPHGFPEIMQAGGFDAVIGNPPYGGILGPEEVTYLSSRLNVFDRIRDAYVAFIQTAHSLLQTKGQFGFIIPSAWLGGPRYKALRDFLLSIKINTVVLLPFDIFADAYIDTVILTTIKSEDTSNHIVRTREYSKKEKLSSIDDNDSLFLQIKQDEWCNSEDKKFILNPGVANILSQFNSGNSSRLDDLIEMKRGVLFDKKLLTEFKKSTRSFPYFEGDIYRYRMNFVASRWIEYGKKMREYPKEFRWFEDERILLRRLVNRRQRLMAITTSETVITNKNLYVIKKLPSSKVSTFYILGLLNSRFISRLYLSQVSQATKDDFPQVTIRDTRQLPVPNINLSNKADVKRHDKMVELVEGMLSLKKKEAAAKTDFDKNSLARRIEATDRAIDELVYELYGLTEEEVRIVEGETSP